jgi:hypothetical protein
MATLDSAVCQSVGNASAAVLPPPPDAATALYTAYAACADGGPYSTYTVEWFDDVAVQADRAAAAAPVGSWGYAAWYAAWGNPYQTSATTLFTPLAYTWTHVQVCGWDGSRYHCAGTTNTATGQPGQVTGEGKVWTTSLLVQNLTVAG